MSDILEDIKFVAQAVNVKYSFVVAIALVVYDTIVKLPDEINLIWLQRWSFGKAFYILARYSNFLDASLVIWYSFDASLTTESCRSLYEAEMWSATFGIAFCYVILVVRTYAIWERKSLVLVYLFSVQLITFIIEAIQVDEAFKAMTFAPSPVPTIVPCIATLGNNRMFTVFCIMLGFEFNILCLMLCKGFFQWRRDSTALIHTLYRDGFIYFVVLFASSMVNAIVISKFFNSPYFYVTIQLQRAFHSILASRLILNLRKVIAEKDMSPRLSRTSCEGTSNKTADSREDAPSWDLESI
ncbi:hypothetical protein SCHPADRAFT_931034 [Schizopora paradoxa]|uniref:DUF6533 domain-containing protein n=1 Tax=Schizopora paradoxa TaxID=27342 RepID=A0A0H2RCZ8_9AGAM|nr:hypothetical protein SCHPADRAFT_931034 [Schizopora paradoxa]